METPSPLPRVWEVPQIFRDRLGSRVGRQRAMFADDHLLLVLHLPPAPDQAERQGRYLWRRPDGSWTSNDLGSSPQVVTLHLDQYAEAIQQLDEMEQQARSAEDYFQVLDRLAPLNRAARNLYQVLQDARQLCPEDRQIIDFRDRAYAIERTAELLYNETKNSLDFLIARQAEDQARASHRMAVSAHRLNVLAAFFFPLATLSAVFGVSLRHGLETYAPPLPFLVFLGLGLTTGILLTLFVTTRRE